MRRPTAPSASASAKQQRQGDKGGCGSIWFVPWRFEALAIGRIPSRRPRSATQEPVPGGAVAPRAVATRETRERGATVCAVSD